MQKYLFLGKAILFMLILIVFFPLSHQQISSTPFPTEGSRHEPGELITRWCPQIPGLPIVIGYGYGAGLNSLSDDIQVNCRAQLDAAIEDWNFVLQELFPERFKLIPIGPGGIISDDIYSCFQVEYTILFRMVMPEDGGPSMGVPPCAGSPVPPQPWFDPCDPMGSPPSDLGNEIIAGMMRPPINSGAIYDDFGNFVKYSVHSIEIYFNAKIYRNESCEDDLYGVALHEIGHALGLGHNICCNCGPVANPVSYVMCEGGDQGGAGIWGIDEGTKNVLRRIYGQGDILLDPEVIRMTSPIVLDALRGFKISKSGNPIIDFNCDNLVNSMSADISELQDNTHEHRSYELYISEDHGPYQLLLKNTNADWVNDSLTLYLSRGYENARMGLRVLEDSAIINESTIPNPLNLPAAIMAVSPDTILSGAGIEGGPFTHDCFDYLIRNNDDATFSWMISSNQDWVEAQTTTGILNAGDSVEVRFCLTEYALTLSPGLYQGECHFTHIETGITQTKLILLHVMQCPSHASLVPANLSFNLMIGKYALNNICLANIAGESCKNLDYQISISTDDSPGANIDEVGSDIKLNAGDNRYRGDIYQVSARTTLTQIESYLNFTGTRELEYVIMEGDLIEGPFIKIYSHTLSVEGSGEGFYSSGPMGVLLQPAKLYLIAVGWTGGNITFYWNSDSPPIPVSFGQQIDGYALDSYPIGDVVGNPLISGNYYQRLTTEDLWLFASPSAGSILPGDSINVEVKVDATGKIEGTYTGQLTITSNDPGNPETIIPVTMNVVGEHMVVVPEQGLNSSGYEGGPFEPQCITYTISNEGGGNVEWNAVCTQPWIDISPPSGIIHPNQSDDVTLCINPAANSLAAGYYSDICTFTNLTTGNSVVRAIELRVDICNDSDGDGFAGCEGDCNDYNSDIYPGADEVCDAIDNNCDGQIDEGLDCGIYGLNLIVNGTAEAGSGASNDQDVFPPPEWTTTSGLTAIQYGAGFLSRTDPAPADRGSNYIIGGPGSEYSTAMQTIDVSEVASDIDGDCIVYELAGYIGGFSIQGDHATVTAIFQDEFFDEIDRAVIGPLLNSDRGNESALLYVNDNGIIPTGTRSILILLEMTRLDGEYNTGSADNLSLIIRQTGDSDQDGVPDGCDICLAHDDNIDTDSDGVPDGCDNCPTLYNPDQVAGFSSQFNNTELSQGWTVISPNPDNRISLTEKPGYLRLVASPKNGGSDLWPGVNYNAPRLTRPVEGDWIVETRLEFSPTNSYQGAGILGNTDKNRVAERAFYPEQGGNLARCIGNYIPWSNPMVYFRIEKQGNTIRGYLSSDGTNWQLNGTTTGEWTSIGLFSIRQPWDGNTSLYSFADFDYLSIESPDTDGDGIADFCDNCLNTPNSNQIDNDNDGYGFACDCDDSDPARKPEAIEICDGLDNNCDGTADEGFETVVQELFTDQVPAPLCMAISPIGAYGAYGDYMYVSSGNDIYRVDPDGNAEYFTTRRGGNGSIQSLFFDNTPDKRFGGYLYMVLDYYGGPCLAGIDRILPDGTVQLFVNGCGGSPGLYGAAGGLIDETGKFGYGMFLSDFESDQNGSPATIFKISTSGSRNPFFNVKLGGITGIDIDLFGDFDGDILAANISRSPWWQGDNSVYRIGPDGSYGIVVPDKGLGEPNDVLVDATGQSQGNLFVHYSSQSVIVEFDASGSEIRRIDAPGGSTIISDRLVQDRSGAFDYDLFYSAHSLGEIRRIRKGTDLDGDGYTLCEGDCDDINPAVNPNVAEACDGIDNNCDGSIDEGFDQDGDGARVCDGDCNDTLSLVYPGAFEICDGLDNDCDGEVDEYLDCGPPLLCAESRTYTTDVDFAEGIFLNVETDGSDRLKLSKTLKTFPFIWVAKSGVGTIVKIDINTGQILGEYRTAPEGQPTNPSRTTVDLEGNVWTGNRNQATGGMGSVVKVGLLEAGNCIDRNGNGIIESSTGLGNILCWPNPGGVNTNGGVSEACDECILLYKRVNPNNVRHVSIDENNNVWVGGNFGGDNSFDLLNSTSGDLLATFNVGLGGYGGLVDQNGVLWSASRAPLGLLRYDTKKTISISDDTYSFLDSPNPYGLGIDGYGNVWNAQWSSNQIRKYYPNGALWSGFPRPSGGATDDRGVAVTLVDNNVWIANSGGNNVSRLDNNGNLLAVITVGSTPTGVAVDANGKVWVTNYNSHNVMRIDPATNQVDLTVALGPNAYPYNYSDMTGAVALGSTSPKGTWTVVYDAGVPDMEWGKVSWSTCLRPDGSIVSARARTASSIAELGGATWIEAPKNEDIEPPDGQFIQVELTLTPNENGEGPEVCDVTVCADVPIQNVKIDVKPQSCPNPVIMNETVKRNALLPVAILGSDSINVTNIDPGTVTLEGLSPIRWEFEDLSTPAEGDTLNCECNELAGDGFTDMTFKFSLIEILGILGNPYDGENIPMTIKGLLKDSTRFEGSDCIFIRGGLAKRLNNNEIPDDYVLEGNYPNPFNAITTIIVGLPVASDVRLDIVNVLGQTVETLYDGRLDAGYHPIKWNASDAASGVYFYRMTSEDFVQTKKMVLLK